MKLFYVAGIGFFITALLWIVFAYFAVVFLMEVDEHGLKYVVCEVWEGEGKCDKEQAK